MKLILWYEDWPSNRFGPLSRWPYNRCWLYSIVWQNYRPFLPTHTIAPAETMPIKNRSKVINSTLFVCAIIIHRTKEAKLETTIMIRFPMSCDRKPPPKNPIMHPTDITAPKVTPFEYRTFNWTIINLNTNPWNIDVSDLYLFVTMFQAVS